MTTGQPTRAAKVDDVRQRVLMYFEGSGRELEIRVNPNFRAGYGWTKNALAYVTRSALSSRMMRSWTAGEAGEEEIGGGGQ